MKLGQKGDIKIESFNLSIVYSLYGQLVELDLSSYENSCPNFKILDQELDIKENSVTISLSNLNELNIIIKDFEQKFKQLIDKNGRS